MGQSKYIYTFVPSGKVPDAQPQLGMKRSDAITNAKKAAARDDHTQDIFRRPGRDATGRLLADGTDAWQLVSTIGKKSEARITKEEATVKECIRAIEAAMPIEEAAKRSRVIHFRREGMCEAVRAIQRHYGKIK